MVKHAQTIRRRKPTNCLSVFDHVLGLALKGLSTLHEVDPLSKLHGTQWILKIEYPTLPKEVNVLPFGFIIFLLVCIVPVTPASFRSSIFDPFLAPLPEPIPTNAPLISILSNIMRHLLQSTRKHWNKEGNWLEYRQPPEIFYKKNVLKSFAEFSGKHLCRSPFFNKSASPDFEIFKDTFLKEQQPLLFEVD